MLTKTLKILALASFCILGLGMVAPMSSQSKETQQSSSKKVYVDPNHLSLDCCGMFIESNEVLRPLSAIFHDESGFYIKLTPTTSGTCGYGHPSVSYIQECADPICPYYYAEADW